MLLIMLLFLILSGKGMGQTWSGTYVLDITVRGEFSTASSIQGIKTATPCCLTMTS